MYAHSLGTLYLVLTFYNDFSTILYWSCSLKQPYLQEIHFSENILSCHGNKELNCHYVESSWNQERGWNLNTVRVFYSSPPSFPSYSPNLNSSSNSSSSSTSSRDSSSCSWLRYGNPSDSSCAVSGCCHACIWTWNWMDQTGTLPPPRWTLSRLFHSYDGRHITFSLVFSLWFSRSLSISFSLSISISLSLSLSLSLSFLRSLYEYLIQPITFPPILCVQVASDCIWSDPASEVMERCLDETGFGDSPRGGGAVW